MRFRTESQHAKRLQRSRKERGRRDAVRPACSLARPSSLSQKLFQGHQRDSHTRCPCAVQLAAWTDDGRLSAWTSPPLSNSLSPGRRAAAAAASIIKTSQVCDPGRRYWRHVFHPCLSLLCTYLGKEKRRGSRFKIVRETGPMIGVTEGSTRMEVSTDDGQLWIVDGGGRPVSYSDR